MEQFCTPVGHQCPLYPARDGRPVWPAGHADGRYLSLGVKPVNRNPGKLRDRGVGETVLQERDKSPAICRSRGRTRNSR